MVSVITPCYNSELYISDAIESVISQTYSDWEMIIIDDCSTDKSALIIDEYCKKDCRIKYMKTNSPSGSPTKPRNIGIAEAIGRYIAFWIVMTFGCLISLCYKCLFLKTLK